MTSKAHSTKIIMPTWVWIGWSKCNIRKRINVTQCYKCWEIGHTAAKCTGKDRQNDCRKCGQIGHKASECDNKPYCPICKVAEHRAGTTGCPIFRRALKEEETRIKENKNKELKHRQSKQKTIMQPNNQSYSIIEKVKDESNILEERISLRDRENNASNKNISNNEHQLSAN
jgi:uncharacterized Zn finger protein (UPF0148 family)